MYVWLIKKSEFMQCSDSWVLGQSRLNTKKLKVYTNIYKFGVSKFFLKEINTFIQESIKLINPSKNPEKNILLFPQ